MTSEMSKSIETLRSSSSRLNQLTDEAAAIVRAVEDFLNTECSSGVRAFVQVSSTTEGYPDYERTVVQTLAYTRIGARFRIANIWSSDDEPDGQVKPWSDSTRDDKLATLEKLPELIAEISKALVHKIDTAEKSLAAASDLAKALVGKAG